MEDRFKFKAWDTIGKRMYRDIQFTDWFHKALKNESVIVLQCTGLKDKDGKLIYEGDIVKFFLYNVQLANGTMGDATEKGKIVFSNGEFVAEYLPPYNWDPMCPCRAIMHPHDDAAVIGNIYENPELLKEESK